MKVKRAIGESVPFHEHHLHSYIMLGRHGVGWQGGTCPPPPFFFGLVSSVNNLARWTTFFRAGAVLSEKLFCHFAPPPPPSKHPAPPPPPPPQGLVQANTLAPPLMLGILLYFALFCLILWTSGKHRFFYIQRNWCSRAGAVLSEKLFCHFAPPPPPNKHPGATTDVGYSLLFCTLLFDSLNLW